jgi:hypothetical protein
VSQFVSRCPVCGAVADFTRRVEQTSLHGLDDLTCQCGKPGCPGGGPREGAVLGWDGGCGHYLALEDYRVWLEATGPEFVPIRKH